MTVSETQIDLADEAACKRDGMFHDIFNQEERRDLIQTILTAALSDQAGGWQDISTAPKDGTVFDVWLGGLDIDEDDIEFYCGVATRRSANWHYLNGKFRPCAGLSSIPTFIHPSHWRPRPAPPPSSTAGEG